jgi:hypothetical protein
MTDTRTDAARYADEISETIQTNVNNGSPFGINEDSATYQDREPGEDFDAIDYLSDVLDIAYTVGSDGTYRSARVLIAFGGPNAWIDTRTGTLDVAWWSAPEVRQLPREFTTPLDDALAELWESR